MGIKEFFDVELPDGGTIGQLGKEVSLEELRDELCGDQQLAMDASFVIYNAIKAMAKPGAMSDRQGRPTAHIMNVINKVLAMDKAGVESLWVFDSPTPNKFKQKEVQKRAANREKAVAKATDDASREKHAFVLTKDIVDETKRLLELLGVNWMEAPAGVEAEAFGAFMSAGAVENRFCLAMFSGDSDVLLFGGTLIRPMKVGKKTVFFKYELPTILDATGLSRRQLVEMGVALGTDFNEKVRGVGPKTAIDKIKRERVEFTSALEEVIEYFMTSAAKAAEEPEIHESSYDLEGLRGFLRERNFKLELWEKRLAKYSKAAAGK